MRMSITRAAFSRGVKWFAGRHWGVRADYRLFMVKHKDTAPAFFGQENDMGTVCMAASC